MITLVAQFTMKAGAERRALRLVDAVKREAEDEQPGTLLYLVHRVLDGGNKETRTLLFYECYRDKKALKAHLNGAAWQALTKAWSRCFEGSPSTIDPTFVRRIGGFLHLDMG